MVWVPAQAGSDKFLPASFRPLEERAQLSGLAIAVFVASPHFWLFFFLLLASPSGCAWHRAAGPLAKSGTRLVEALAAKAWHA